MRLMKNIEDIEASIENDIYRTSPTKEEVEKSRVGFETRIKDAVAKGGKVEIEDRKVSSGETQQFYTLRISKTISMSISKDQAVRYCGYAE